MTESEMLVLIESLKKQMNGIEERLDRLRKQDQEFLAEMRQILEDIRTTQVSAITI